MADVTTQDNSNPLPSSASMPQADFRVQKSAKLAVYLGETYAEFEIKSFSTDDNDSSSVTQLTPQTIYKKNVFLPQTSLKTALNQLAQAVQNLQCQLTDIYIVCRYLERLKTFRLGGSVVQVVHKGFEDCYTAENTSRVSLAASALIISIEKNMTPEFLTTELARIKKINPDANKVVLQLDPQKMSLEDSKSIQNFFEESGFKVFHCENPQDLFSIRKTLLNAGSEGTKEEIISEFKERFPEAQVHFWIKDSFQNTPFENYDLYFSSQDFLSHCLKKSGKKNLVHMDVENWMILTEKTKSVWDSPWGKIERPHAQVHPMALQPLTEILVDETARLQFSKTPASSEPGPMVAGRGVKSLLIDLFFNSLKEKEYFWDLFPQLKNPLLQTKIESQFKVIEKGQKHDKKAFSQQDLIHFLHELIEFELELKMEHSPEKTEAYMATGQFAPLLLGQQDYSWTEKIWQNI